MMSEEIKLSREVEAIAIPAGVAKKLAAGTEVIITQELGGTFTVHTPHEGGLFRIQGKDADALGRKAVTVTKSSGGGAVGEDEVWAVLKTCYDPEIPVNMVDLGLIYSCKITKLEGGGNRVDIQMTLTAPGCGMGDFLASDVKQKVAMVPNVTEVNVELTFDPPWSHEMMSDAAKLQTGMYY